MEYRRLGRSGLVVSRATLGAMNFGGPTDETEARRIVDAYLDAGGTVVDTADVYTGGASEEIVGRAIATRRDQVVLATKGSGPLGTGPNEFGLSRLHLTRALEASLRRLGTDHVDLYQLHNWYDGTPLEEVMATLDGFVRAGKVRYLGCSNFTAAQIVAAQWAAEKVGGTPLTALQPNYSLLARTIEAEILPTCDRHGLGTLTYAPLASGMLAGRYRRDAEPDTGSRMHQWLNFPVPAAGEWARTLLSPRGFDIADEVVRTAETLGTTPSAVAIAWIGTRPEVDSVILGPRTERQLRETLDGFALELPPERRERLDTISDPGTVPVTGAPIRLAPQRGPVAASR